VALACLIGPSVAAGQDYRGWTTTSVQVVELRPVSLDSVPLGDERTVAATQDLSLTYWGLGVEGLSVTALARVRVRDGGELRWPRSDREFDAMLAYAQLQRGPLRLRAGRQDVQSGLGLSAFDGVGAAYSLGVARGEIYGGRSLARGLREPANSALRSLDDFFLDHSVLLVGGSASARALGTLVTARYHREILWDRSSLVSERASLDFSTFVDRVRITGSADYDLSFEHVGKAELTASAPLAEGRWLVELSGRRYVPYFDLSTIWGFFEPVSYSEVVARVGWSPLGTFGLWASGGRRTYGATGATVILQPMRDTGWRADLGAHWAPHSAWTVDGRYELEWGPGGFLSSVDLSGRYRIGEDLGVSLSALSFQQIEEYRLGEGRAFGMGASADYAWGERVSLVGGFSLIRHRDGGNKFTSPWDQGRAWSSLRFDLGGDPGLADRAGRR
jgi:hypothetical protein